MEDNDFFVNHCTSTYLCKRAFKRVCENAYPKSDEKVKSIFGCTGPAGGMTIKLKEQQTLYETKVCLRLRHGDHRLDGPRSALPSWLIMEAGPGPNAIYAVNYVRHGDMETGIPHALFWIARAEK